MGDQTPELRAEIEAILVKSQKRHGYVYREMAQGLTADDMAKRHDKTPAHMRRFVASVGHILDGTMPTTSVVLTNSYGYRELLNYDTTRELHEYVASWLVRLKQKKDDVSFEPLDGDALAPVVASRRRTDIVEVVCAQCFMVHPGECY